MTINRASWLERHDEFEGVGAHELNPRYDHVDGGDWDAALRELVKPTLADVPALFRAQLFVGTVPIRFDGADISHYQDDAGPIAWRDLRDGSWWIATKVTQSIRSVDRTFGIHWANMRALQFTHRLAYHWLSSTTDPEEQAFHYLRTVGAFLPGEGAMLDAEEGGITVDKCLAWCEAVEAVTRRPSSVYSGAYVTGGTIWQSTLLRTSKYGPRPMHLAAYTTEAKAKSLPGVKAYPWSAWQFSSNGPVAGIVGRCDMNRVDNVAAYDLACGIVAPVPIPQPLPQGDDDVLRLLVLTDSPVRLFAMCTPQGAALRCEWTGPGDSAGSNPRIEFYRAAHPAGGAPFEMGLATGSLINVSLDGVLPQGLRAEDFANPEEILARMTTGTVDTVARAAVTQLNDAVGRVGQSVGDIQSGLIKAGGG